MTWRLLGLLTCGLVLAVACGSDDDNQQPPDEEVGGAGGEAGSPSSNTGGATAPTAGSSGSAGTGAGGSAGTTAGGAPGVAGAAGGGDTGASGEGGAPSQPGGVSACGANKYQTGDGCSACPPPPTSSEPSYLNCATFDLAAKNELILTVAFKDVELHEPLGGEQLVSWVNSDTSSGEATVPWQYSPEAGQFMFDFPLDARYAVEFTFGGWSFTDACGFPFQAALRVAETPDGWICALIN